MKNKIVASLLVLSMLFVGIMLTGCSKSAAEVIEPAFNNTKALKSYSATMVISVKSDNDFNKVDDSTTSQIELNGKKMYVKTGVTGNDKMTELYTDGEWVYSYASKMGNKKKVSDDNKLTYAEELKKLFIAPTAESLAEIEMVENEDGSQSATIAIDKETLNKNYNEYVSGISVFKASNLPIDLYDGKLEITVNEAGYVTAYKVTCKTDRTWIGNQLVHDITFDITFDNPGADITVTDLPAKDVKFIEIK